MDKIEVTQADIDCAEQVHACHSPIFAARIIARHRLSHTPRSVEPVATDVAALVEALESAFKAADVILAPICAASGRYLYDHADCPNMIAELSGEGVVISAKDFADLYEATHPDILAALKDRTDG